MVLRNLQEVIIKLNTGIQFRRRFAEYTKKLCTVTEGATDATGNWKQFTESCNQLTRVFN